MARRTSIVLLLTGLAAFVPVSTQGQATAPASANDRPTLTDRATDDAVQRLYDAIADMPVIANNATLSVAALLSSSPQAERQLRQTVLAQMHISQARQVSPGVIAIDVSIDASRLNEALQAAIKDEPSAAPRHLKIAPATAPVILATGQACEDGLARDSHPGWRHCTPNDINMSHKAAERDLRQRLLAWLLRATLANGSTMSQLARQDSRINHSLRRQLDRITGSEFILEPTGVCVLTCTVSAEQLTALLRTAMTQGELTLSGELRPAVAFENTMSVQGFSLTPPRPIAGLNRLAGRPRPSWAGQTLTKTASATAPKEMSVPIARKELAIQAARIEASRQLWIELEKLTMPDGQGLGKHLVSRPDREQIAAAINAAVITLSRPSVNDQGTATVTLGLKLENVWQIVGE